MPKPAKPLSAFEHPAVAVDLVLVTVVDGALRVLLMRRDDDAVVGGEWALPGGFVHIDKSLEETVEGVLRDKANVQDIYLEQLGTYGAVDRDPRGRVISVAYFALIPSKLLFAANRAADRLQLSRIQVPWEGERGGLVDALNDEDKPLTLAFDHAVLLGEVVKRLRRKLDYTGIGFELLPELFTLADVQQIHEAILGRSLAKPAFRRKLLDRGLIRATGKSERRGAHRPAELYQRIENG